MQNPIKEKSIILINYQDKFSQALKAVLLANLKKHPEPGCQNLTDIFFNLASELEQEVDSKVEILTRRNHPVNSGTIKRFLMLNFLSPFRDFLKDELANQGVIDLTASLTDPVTKDSLIKALQVIKDEKGTFIRRQGLDSARGATVRGMLANGVDD